MAIVKVLPEDFHINERIRAPKSFLADERHIRLRVFPADSYGGQESCSVVTQQIFSQTKDLLQDFRFERVDPYSRQTSCQSHNEKPGSYCRI